MLTPQVDQIARLTARIEKAERARRAAVEKAETARRAAIVRARRVGYTWQQIGDALGVSRQAAQERYGVLTVPTWDTAASESHVSDS